MKPTTDKEVNGFTPGEWEFEQIKGNNYYEHHVFSRNGGKYGSYVIAQLGMEDTGEKEPSEIKANATLIASAPILKAENNKLAQDVKVLREAAVNSLFALKTGYIQDRAKANEILLSALNQTASK